MSHLSPPPPMLRSYGSFNSDIDTDERGTFRALIEAFVSLFVAVLLFRTFAAEGYMISTGSMAPCLLGFHKRVVCPTCHTTFPFGTAYDTDEDPDSDALAANRSRAVCPNCGQSGIEVSEVPRNHGDQLLVNKQAFLYRSPQRWDVVVFRNPAHPTEAYVKRAIGLPGERLQIVGGDIVVDGQIARKNYRQQLATRILVHDHNFSPINDDGFKSHWQIAEVPGESSEQTKLPTWAPSGRSFLFRGGDVRRPDKRPVAWIEYRHWLRSGGQHDTAVPLERWPEDLDVSVVPNAGLKYDLKKKEFSVTGALSAEIAQQLLDLSKDETFRTAVRDLYEGSHVVPVSDEYGYNPIDEVGTPNPVRDLMVSTHVVLQGGTGEFIIEMTNGATVFSVIFDVIRREVRLYADTIPEGMTLSSQTSGPKSDPISTAAWPTKFGNEGGKVDVSLFDKQVLIAINGKQLMDPFPFEMPAGVQPPRVPVRFGVRGLDVKINQLKLYRDIFYTETRSKHAINRPYELHDNEFFVLGDNSPVSHDSRRWEKPCVHRSLLIGKPFLVHLPSKPGNLRIGNKEMHLRIPDWERIRLLK